MMRAVRNLFSHVAGMARGFHAPLRPPRQRNSARGNEASQCSRAGRPDLCHAVSSARAPRRRTRETWSRLRWRPGDKREDQSREARAAYAIETRAGGVILNASRCDEAGPRTGDPTTDDTPGDGRRLFAVICRHCKAAVLTTPRSRQAEQGLLVAHLQTRHPSVNYHASKLGPVAHTLHRPTPPTV